MLNAYSTDLNVWIKQTIDSLKKENWHEIDINYLIEEVENLGKSERRGISSQLTRLLLHLLKWQYQPQRRSDSWLDSITDARTQIELAIEDSPSLKTHPATELENCYTRARRQAAQQTNLDISIFPVVCEYDLDLVLSDRWLP